jgi:hypothetical protein
MHAFIIRPFGSKEGIDFERVEAELIIPALRALGFSGGTTGEILEQGNIRSDLFGQLLVADLVIADLSIHNANVFYELGIRHALRKRHTFLIRSTAAQEVPFDLKTDRYLHYDAANPADSLVQLIDAFRATWCGKSTDSPVFSLLPDLPDANALVMQLVPLAFQEAVDCAVSTGDSSLLQLMGEELNGVAWKSAGLRLIGLAQKKIKDWECSLITWKKVLDYDDRDVEANCELATIYERLGDLLRSSQALERVLDDPCKTLTPEKRAEVNALLGRNAKTGWRKSWGALSDREAVQRMALSSELLEKSYNYYKAGFAADRNHFYSGLNALAMLTIRVTLAELNPEVWQLMFENPDEAERMLMEMKRYAATLAQGVRLAIDSRQEILNRELRTDPWVTISDADLCFLTSDNSAFIGHRYKYALADIDEFDRDSALKQIELYRSLSLFPEKTSAAFQGIQPRIVKSIEPRTAERAIVFTGHRMDAPRRAEPRFPARSESKAREMIKAAVEDEQRAAGGTPLIGISGAASGGDILFLEVCQELGIPIRIYLAVPKQDYIRESVSDSGPQWVERFNRLYEAFPPRLLSEDVHLPVWLQSRNDYNIWQRANLWILFNALRKSQGKTTLIALWNGEPGDALGGTADMVKRAGESGAKIIKLDAKTLIAECDKC